jgi:2-keto-4-pentenoate hydratase
MLDGPLGAVRFLLAHLAGRGIDTSGGLWVSTGAVTGVHDIAVGQSAVADFGPMAACAAPSRRPNPPERTGLHKGPGS